MLEEIITSQLVISIIIVLVGIVLFFALSFVLGRIVKTDFFRESSSARHTVKTLGSIIKGILTAAVIFLVFEINGINVASLVTGLGLVGAAATLAAQDIMKDMLNGIYISGEKVFSKGDYVQYNDMVGQVVDFSLRSTKIKSIDSDYTLYVSNRNITEIKLVYNLNAVSLPLPYETDVETAEEIMESVVTRLKALSEIEEAKYLGVDNFASSSIEYKIMYACNPLLKRAMGRTLRKIFLEEIGKRDISVPYEKVEIINS